MIVVKDIEAFVYEHLWCPYYSDWMRCWKPNTNEYRKAKAYIKKQLRKDVDFMLLLLRKNPDIEDQIFRRLAKEGLMWHWSIDVDHILFCRRINRKLAEYGYQVHRMPDKSARTTKGPWVGMHILTDEEREKEYPKAHYY